MTDIDTMTQKLRDLLGTDVALQNITKADVPYLECIDIACFDEAMGWDWEDFEDEIDQQGFRGWILYAGQGGDRLPIAYILGHTDDLTIEGRVKTDGIGFYVSATAVAPAFRQRGIFTELYTLLESRVSSNYLFFHARSEANQKNKGEVAWFMKHGYQEHCLAKDYYDAGDDASMMVKLR